MSSAADGGGTASRVVASVADDGSGWQQVAETTTADGVTHRLWRSDDVAVHRAVADDLSGRHALIADGHHRYATYRERQRLRRDDAGPGPWDRGLALLVDTSEYGPNVHPIHRTVTGLGLDAALELLPANVDATRLDAPGSGDPSAALRDADGNRFAAVVTDGDAAYLVVDTHGELAEASRRGGHDGGHENDDSLTALDVTVLHRGLVESVWHLVDDVDTVGYAHDVDEAMRQAHGAGGFAVLLRATPVDAVARVAAAGARMPRKSTLFTPKPASGLVMRRLSDQPR